MNEDKKRLFLQLTDYLGEALGSDFEIVVHSINKDQIENSEIIALKNEHISGRNLNSPLTDLALEMIQNKEYKKADYKANYKAITRSGSKIKGSTFFIKNDDNQIEGMLCINHDTSRMKKLAHEMLAFCENESTPEQHGDKDISTEILSSSIEDILYSVIDPVFLNEGAILSPKQKEMIISTLFDKGVFTMKGSVQKVAKILHISEPTVYRYLKDLP